MEWIAPAIIFALALLTLAAGLLAGSRRQPAAARDPEETRDSRAWCAASGWLIAGAVATILTTATAVIIDQDGEELLWAGLIGSLVLLTYLALAAVFGRRAAQRSA